MVVLIVSMIVVRVGATALSMTGLSQELARFQARSAFTGAGFTTSESEQVVHHPVRRRIIMLLMLLGNVGIVSAISSMVISFVPAGETRGWTDTAIFRLAMLGLGLSLLWMISNTAWVDRQLSRLIGWALKRWTSLELRDYAGVLHLSRGYIVSEFAVREEDWLANRRIEELRLSEEGVLVLGIDKPDGTYLGAVRGPTLIEAGDTLFLYGREDAMAELDRRRAGGEGDQEHRQAIDRQRQVEAEEREAEERSEASRGIGG
jgi:hypothetical protein